MPAIILRPADADITSANAAARAQTTGTNFDFTELDYDDTTDEHADWNVVLDEYYNSGTMYVDIYWKAAAIAGSVVWQANVRGIAKGEIWDGAVGADSYVQETVQGTTEYLCKATITISAPGVSPSEAFIIRISRDANGTHGTDNMAGDARLLLISIRFNVAD